MVIIFMIIIMIHIIIIMMISIIIIIIIIIIIMIIIIIIVIWARALNTADRPFPVIACTRWSSRWAQAASVRHWSFIWATCTKDANSGRWWK